MLSHWYLIFATAAIPLFTGMIWYNPKTFGTIWMNASGVDPTPPSGKKMALVFALTYFFGLLLSVMIMPLVIHQMHITSVFEGNPALKDPNSEISLYIKNFFDNYGTNFRTFKHGAFHGTIDAIFFALPIIGTGALFEKKGFKYIAVHVGYWMLTLALMGGVICQFV